MAQKINNCSTVHCLNWVKNPYKDVQTSSSPDCSVFCTVMVDLKSAALSRITRYIRCLYMQTIYTKFNADDADDRNSEIKMPWQK